MMTKLKAGVCLIFVVMAVGFVAGSGVSAYTIEQWDLAVGSGEREVLPVKKIENAATLAVEIIDGETNVPTAAMVRLLDETGRLWIPEQAVAITQGGRKYDVEQGQKWGYQYRVGYTSWGKFAVKGRFEIKLPAGVYSLLVRKGREYRGYAEEITLKANQAESRRVVLDRWLDMPKLGWYSGDDHLHYRRSSPAVNDQLMTWVQAEDIHVANILQMDNAKRTYFPQYAFGKAGRYQRGNFILVPGEEGSRSKFLGHMSLLNIQSSIWDPQKNYYLYDDIIDETERQGGLPEFDHVNTPEWFKNIMITLSAYRGKVTTSQVTHKLVYGKKSGWKPRIEGWKNYYKWLDLGYRLNLSSGSDSPWATLGMGYTRVYVYTGGPFDADKWFENLQRGRSFISQGDFPLFTVNGQLPGSEISVKPGEKIHIEADVYVSPDNRQLTTVELLVEGKVIKQIKQADKDVTKIHISDDLTVKRSIWIVCRSTYSHTSPVYIRVGDEPWWNVETFSRLLADEYKRLDELDNRTRIGGDKNLKFEDESIYKKQRPELLRRAQRARKFYNELEAKFKAARGRD